MATLTDACWRRGSQQSWIRKQAPENFRKAMRKAIDELNGNSNEKTVSLLKDIVDGSRSFSFFPWCMSTFGAWIDRFGVAVR